MKQFICENLYREHCDISINRLSSSPLYRVLSSLLRILPSIYSPYSAILTSQSDLSYSHPSGMGPIGRPHWPTLYPFWISAGPREKIFFSKKNKIKIFCQGGEMSTNSDKYHPLLPFPSPPLSFFLLTIFPLHPPFPFFFF